MGWEDRNGLRYYYRGYRDADGTVRKEYYGNDLRAQHAAEQDAHKRRQRLEEEEAVAQLCLDTHHAKLLLTLYSERCTLLFEASMYAKGYHYHRGEWRRRGCPGRPKKHPN